MDAPDDLEYNQRQLWDQLALRILSLSKVAWEGGVNWPGIESWLGNFDGRAASSPSEERLHALYILSQFMFYGKRELRVLLRALYEELFLMPLATAVKSRAPDFPAFELEMSREMAATKFLGVGNPSESGMHLLYYFRQENSLSKSNFMDSAQIYRSTRIDGVNKRVPRYDEIKRYVFIDDICGSGETAVRYSSDLLPDLIAGASDIEVHYLSIFATSEGLSRVKRESTFGSNAAAVHELDHSYKWTSPRSRYLSSIPEGLDKEVLIRIPMVYGQVLCPMHPLGFDDGQLMLGFTHNTPDNSLPIIWSDIDNSGMKWNPIFKRYPKV